MLRCVAILVALAGCSAATDELAGAPGGAQFASCSKPLPTVPDPSAPHGLMVWIDSLAEIKSQPEILKYLPSDSRLCGASILVMWSAIDRGPSVKPQYDFAPLEVAMAPWLKANKMVNILVAGVNEVGPVDTATPAWVLAQSGANEVHVVPCSNPGGGQEAGPPTPVYWEPGYRRPWGAFIAAMIRKYGSNPHIGYIRFGLGAGAEDFPQHGADANCFAAWAAYGLSAKRWATYSTSLVSEIAAESRRNSAQVQQLVALNTFDDPQHPFDVVGAVARSAYDNAIGFGTENLGSGNYGTTTVACANNSPVPYWCHAFDEYAGKVPLQFQPISWTLNPAFPKLAPLTQLLPYALYNHAQIFELYYQEWLTADDPVWPTYHAHHVAWSKALASAARALGGAP